MSIASHASVTDRLGQPEAYAERPDHVDEIETHISHVFLTHRYAYKLKKPVQFDFLDFSTAEKRRWACEEELRLNRRLCPDVYLAVQPITMTARGKLAVNGTGTPVDWVVKMRRLPAERRLDHMLLGDGVEPREIDALVRTLNQFYLRQPPLTILPDAYRTRIRGQIRSNWSDLLENLPREIASVNRSHSALLRYLTLQPAVFDRRVCDGRVVDGHGDLRPEHIYFVSPPAVIDCLEFNEAMRQVDIADELSFFAMECEKIGHDEVGLQILASYCATTNDRPDGSLMAFYKAYRACVRAKVCSLRAAQTDGSDRQALQEQAKSYLDLASNQVSELGPHLVIAVTGFSGTGKSTLASALADTLGGELLQTDVVRRQRLGESTSVAGYQEDNYRPGFRQQVYDELLARAKALLAQGAMLVLDGTFLQARNREALLELTLEQHALPVFVRCECPQEIAIARIQRRRGADPHQSEAYPGLFAHQAAELESEGDLPAFAVDTCQPLEDQVQAVMDHLRTLLESEPAP